MQLNTIQNFRQCFIVFEKRGIFSKKIENLTSLFWRDLFCLDLKLFAKIEKGLVSAHLQKLVF